MTSTLDNALLTTNRPRYKVAMFDIYGTLATWSPDRGTIQSRAAAAYGVNLTREGIEAGYTVAEAFMTHQNTERPVRLMSPAERDAFFAKFEQMVLDGAGFHVDLDLAHRIWRTVSQVELDRFERSNSVRGAFATNYDFTDAHVLLIDDVATTGSTLMSCASALKHAGAKRVSALTFAKEMSMTADDTA